MTFVVLLLHALYALIIYLFNPRQKAPLVFFLLVTAGFTVVSDNDHILQTWFPINYMWAQKIRLFSYMGVSFFILYLTLSFYGKKEGRRWFYAYTALLVTYSAFVLFASPPLIYYSRKAMLFGFLYLFPMLWFVYLAVRMVLKRQHDSIYLLLAIISIASSIVWGTFQFSEKVTSVFFPVDLIAAIVAFSAYWFKRYFRHAEENARLNEQLRESDRLKDRFLANTSHELRTPLHGIMNIAQNLVAGRRQSLDGPSLEDLRLIISIGRRMSHMVEDLLDIVRLQEKRIVLKKEPLAVASVVSGVLGMLRFMTEGKPVRLALNIPQFMPPVLADEKRFVQIVFNLVHNALKYTAQGTVAVSAKIEYGQAWIEVSDTGRAWMKRRSPACFSAMNVAFMAVTTAGNGPWIKYLQGARRASRGAITLRSEPGKGSTFSFSLPLADSHSLPDEQLAVSREELSLRLTPEDLSSLQVESPPFEEGRANILAVDDDPVNLKVLAGILRSEPYNVKLVTSADEALAQLELQQWDLIVADVMMPVRSGYDLTRKVRERFSVSELPVLLLTARSEPADIYAGFKSGANDYVAKPVDALELKYRIRSLTALKLSVHERSCGWKPHIFRRRSNLIFCSTR
ncbi:response regulator [Paenibacillus sp. P25]|nr:response regulator [Paenibacillus sp. P25]